MFLIPTIDSMGKPLMPCHPARARQLFRQGRAKRRWLKGIFHIQLLDREGGEVQPIAVGCDPGSKREAFTVKSARHTYLNILLDAVTWVKDSVKTRRDMRHSRRSRNTPCRKNRINRKRGGLSPSTRARWGLKVRVSKVLTRLFPVTVFVVEDIKARTKGKQKWNQSFSPLQIGKTWFYQQLEALARVELREGWQTKELRNALGLKKTKLKMAETFDAHCVDSWVLANDFVGGHSVVDNRAYTKIIPLRFHRRQLHKLQPSKGSVRTIYGGTRSHGFTRGALVKHIKYGFVYVGGASRGRISLHSIQDGSRLTQIAKPIDCTFLAFSSWRMPGYL